MHLLQILGLLAAIPVGGAMYFAAYTLFKKKRKWALTWSIAIALALMLEMAAYFLDQTHRYTMLFNLTGILGFSFGKTRAMEKHPEAFGLPKKEEI